MFRSCPILAAVIVGCFGMASAEERDLKSSFAQSQLLDILFNGSLDKELEIIVEQKAELKDLQRIRQTAIRDSLARIQEARTNKASPPSLVDIKAEVDREAMESVVKVLLPHQARRWKQIGIQLVFRSDKAQALLVVEIARELRLTDEQRAEMKQLFADGEAELAQAETRIRRDREARMLKVLTGEQRAAWGELVGEPLKFSPR